MHFHHEIAKMNETKGGHDEMTKMITMNGVVLTFAVKINPT